MTARVTAEVVDTEVEAEYQGTVYERTVIIRMGKKELSLFEGTNVITDSDRGSTVELKLRAHLVQDLSTVANHELGLHQELDRESKWSATVIGKAISTDIENDSNDQTALVDIGFGTIHLQIDNTDIETNELENGDIIRAHCGRIDIVGRH